MHGLPDDGEEKEEAFPDRPQKACMSPVHMAHDAPLMVLLMTEPVASAIGMHSCSICGSLMGKKADSGHEGRRQGTRD